MFQLIIISAKKKRSENDKCAFNLEIIFVLNEKREKKRRLSFYGLFSNQGIKKIIKSAQKKNMERLKLG
jgi:hypothetical protein